MYINVNEFTASEINGLGTKISLQNAQGHLLSVHNETNQNPFENSAWATYQVLQGPKTTNLNTLYNGLMARKNVNQPLYAQEVLWYGNIYQLSYTDVQLRKNAWVIIMAAGALNFADNSGDSSSGYSGTLDINQRHQTQHNIIKSVWDFMETIPYYQLTPTPGITNSGYCLAKTGKMYLVYIPTGGTVSVSTPMGTSYSGTWINASNTSEKVDILGLTDGKNLSTPNAGDWL